MSDATELRSGRRYSVVMRAGLSSGTTSGSGPAAVTLTDAALRPLPDRLRIGVVTHNYPPHLGGLEAIAHQLTRGFARQHDVTVVTTGWDGQSGVTTEDGATVHRLPAWHGAERRGVPYAMPLGPGARKAFEALRSCDVLHAHGSLYSTTLLALLARRRDVPLFITEHVGFVPYLVADPERAAATCLGVDRGAGHASQQHGRRVQLPRARLACRAVRQTRGRVSSRTVSTPTRFGPRSVLERQQARARLGLPAERGAGSVCRSRRAEEESRRRAAASTRRSYRLVVCGARRDAVGRRAGPRRRAVRVHAGCVRRRRLSLHAATGEGFPVTMQEAMASGLPVTLLWDNGYAGSVDRDALVAVDSLDELGASRGQSSRSLPSVERRSATVSREFALRNWSWDSTVEHYLDLFRTARREAMNELDSSAASDPKVAVVVPAFNEANSIAKVVADFRAALPGARIVVVDNARPIERARLPQAPAPKWCGKHVGARDSRCSLACAMRLRPTSSSWSTATAPIRPRALRRSSPDPGRRRHGHRHAPAGRRARARFLGHSLGNRAFIAVVRLLFGIRTLDLFSGYRALTRRLLEQSPLIAQGFEIETELSIQAFVNRFRVEEVPVGYGARTGDSQSKLHTIRDGYRIPIAILAFFRDYRPLTCFGLMALLLFARVARDREPSRPAVSRHGPGAADPDGDCRRRPLHPQRAEHDRRGAAVVNQSTHRRDSLAAGVEMELGAGRRGRDEPPRRKRRRWSAGSTPV